MKGPHSPTESRSTGSSTPMLSTLDASGRRITPPAAIAWSKRVAGRVRRRLGKNIMPPMLTAYRHAGVEQISLEILGMEGNFYPLTFELGSEYQYDDHALSVPDAAEAIHLCSLLTARLDTTVSLV